MKTILFIICILIISGCGESKKPAILHQPFVYNEKPSDSSERIQTLKKSDTIDIAVGKVGDKELTYDCLGCFQTWSAGIRVYYLKNGKKRLLFENLNKDIDEGYYIDDVSVFRYNADYFIYVGKQHTYGHYQGYLYYLNPKNMKVHEVSIRPARYSVAIKKMTDTLSFRKSIWLTKDQNNKLESGEIYDGSEATQYYRHCEYHIVKSGTHRFVLIPENEVLEEFY